MQPHRHMSTQVTFSSVALALGRFSGEEIESSRQCLCSARTHGEGGKSTGERKRQKKYGTFLSPRQHCSSFQLNMSLLYFLSVAIPTKLSHEDETAERLTVSRGASL